MPRSYFIATVVCGLVIVGPALERRGHWDHWLAWSLYAPHTSRVDVEFAAVSATKLPTDIGKHLRDDHDGDGWRTLDLAAWSLVSRGVPIYPQGRYQLRLIQSLMRQHQMQNGIRVRQRGVADRMTGRRIETRQIGKRILP